MLPDVTMIMSKGCTLRRLHHHPIKSLGRDISSGNFPRTALVIVDLEQHLFIEPTGFHVPHLPLYKILYGIYVSI